MLLPTPPGTSSGRLTSTESALNARSERRKAALLPLDAPHQRRAWCAADPLTSAERLSESAIRTATLLVLPQNRFCDSFPVPHAPHHDLSPGVFQGPPRLSSFQTRFRSPAPIASLLCLRLPKGLPLRTTWTPSCLDFQSSLGPCLSLTSCPPLTSIPPRTKYNYPHFLTCTLLLPRFLLPCSPQEHVSQSGSFSTIVKMIVKRCQTQCHEKTDRALSPVGRRLGKQSA